MESAAEWRGLSDEQWRRVEWALPMAKKKPFLRRRRKGGRPRWPDRRCFEAVVWLMRTGAAWDRLPTAFGHRRTIQRRLDHWRRERLYMRLWERYLAALGDGDLRELDILAGTAALRHEPEWRVEYRVVRETLFRARPLPEKT